MTLEEYFNKYPEGFKYRDYLRASVARPPSFDVSHPGVIEYGMIRFSPQSAPHLMRPFPGDCALFILRDTRKVRVPKPDKHGYYKPGRTHSLAANGTHWAKQRPNEPWTGASIKRPYEVYVSGFPRDLGAASWARYCTTRQEARETVRWLEEHQPLNLKMHLLDQGFVTEGG